MDSHHQHHQQRLSLSRSYSDPSLSHSHLYGSRGHHQQHHSSSASRQPLGDTSGNAQLLQQHHGLAAVTPLCSQSAVLSSPSSSSLSSSSQWGGGGGIPSMPTPPAILPTQSHDGFGPAVDLRLSSFKETRSSLALQRRGTDLEKLEAQLRSHDALRRLREHDGGGGSASIAAGSGAVLRGNGVGPGLLGMKMNVNPFQLLPQFQTYRNKQREKSIDDKGEQKWPEVLEDAFLDAILLIPQMRRRKYTMHGEQKGRNMLISLYLWIAYCMLLPPGVEPDESLRRTRKQVSSHIQVLKGFFDKMRCYHFFFPGKEKPGKDDRRRDPIEAESFKENPVLRALGEGQLPSERPNYEYFARLLASDELIIVRPSKCWILVSSESVRYVAEENTAYNVDTGVKLDRKHYPHLDKNLKRDEWPSQCHNIKGPLVHEYTQSLTQKESSSVRDIAQDWEEDFPELYQTLDSLVQENLQDILHFHVVLEVHDVDHFPASADLNSWVEVTIEQPSFQGHNWKVRTSLSRPSELCREAQPPSAKAADEEFFVVESSMGNQVEHKPGCDGRNMMCDCVNARRRAEINVPCPAEKLAIMLSRLASYPEHPFVEAAGAAGAGGRARNSQRQTRRRSSDEDEDGDDDNDDDAEDERLREDEDADANPTQMDLIKKVAMIQELWSQELASMGQQTNPRWTRRAAILYTFETVFSINPKRKNSVIRQASGSTCWRFITTLDPTSAYHQQQALIHGDDAAGTAGSDAGSALSALSASVSGAGQSQTLGLPATIHRDQVMSPTPTFQQHLHASMSENFHAAAAWGSSQSHSHQQNQHHQTRHQYSHHGAHHHKSHPTARNQQHQHHHMTTPLPHYGPTTLSLLDASFPSSAGSGLATPPPTATGLSCSFAERRPPAASMAATLAPSNLSFISTASTAVDSDAGSVAAADHPIDPFLSASFSSYVDVDGEAAGGLCGWDVGGLSGLDAGAGAAASSQWATDAGGQGGAWGASHHGSSGGDDGHPHYPMHHQQQHQAGKHHHRHHQQHQHWAAAPDERDLWATTATTATAAPSPASTSTFDRNSHHHHHHHAWSHHGVQQGASGPEPSPSGLSPALVGGDGASASRKRARSDSFSDGDDGGHDHDYPLATLSKLSGHASVSSAKYTAGAGVGGAVPAAGTGLGFSLAVDGLPSDADDWGFCKD